MNRTESNVKGDAEDTRGTKAIILGKFIQPQTDGQMSIQGAPLERNYKRA